MSQLSINTNYIEMEKYLTLGEPDREALLQEIFFDLADFAIFSRKAKSDADVETSYDILINKMINKCRNLDYRLFYNYAAKKKFDKYDFVLYFNKKLSFKLSILIDQLTINCKRIDR